MNTPLLYRPSPPWRICTAFAGAVLLHVAAIAIAAHQPPPIPFNAVPEPPGIEVEISTLPESAPPPAEPEEAPPPPTVEPPEFIEETPPPLPTRKRREATPPIRRPGPPPVSRVTNFGAAKVLALSAPRPEYPYEARRQRVTGSGVVLLTVDTGSGRVTHAQVLRSTGHASLDQAALTGFRRWRFAPGTVSRVQVPITYTLSGASF